MTAGIKCHPHNHIKVTNGQYGMTIGVDSCTCQADLEPIAFLPQPFKCWDYSHMPSHEASQCNLWKKVIIHSPFFKMRNDIQSSSRQNICMNYSLSQQIYLSSPIYLFNQMGFHQYGPMDIYIMQYNYIFSLC